MMQEMQSVPLPAGTPEARGVREVTAAMLRGASAMLDRLAAGLAEAGAAAHQAPAREPVLEFYAEAGAPEGALYVDGQLVGVLAGVSRL